MFGREWVELTGPGTITLGRWTVGCWVGKSRSSLATTWTFDQAGRNKGELVNEHRKKSDMDKWPIPALLFIGIGIGLLTGQMAASVIIGFGLGLLITYLTSGRKN